MKIIADLHTHTVACDHAYSTLAENCEAAAERGLIAIAATEHACAMLGGPSPVYFYTKKPKEHSGVRIFSGAEVNILGPDTGEPTAWGDMTKWREFAGGNGFDLPDHVLKRIHYVIASIHEPIFNKRNVAETTEIWLKVLDNPNIDCLGHLDRAMECDYEVIVKKAAEKDVIVEINNHSFDLNSASSVVCEKIARFCMQFGTQVAVTSDAHFMHEVGVFNHSLALLESVGFPEELVVNADEARLRAFLARRGVEF